MRCLLATDAAKLHHRSSGNGAAPGGASTPTEGLGTHLIHQEIPLLNLLTSPSTRRTMRAVLNTVTDAVRSVVSPAALVEARATETPATVAAEPTDLYTEADMPELATIERAALSLDLANDNARRADRAKRAARKVLDRLPAGTYGTWIVERVASSRQTADLDQIRAIFKAHGLGPVPMKTNSPSLKVRRAEIVPAVEDIEQLAGATV